ncbi:unannotated protein [freshwater metagenome]|uniref:Unannotated protein n=1 Tax=freshwater metagenome TaxID=449393 RepID=A0A6J7K528_9ZZZZ
MREPDHSAITMPSRPTSVPPELIWSSRGSRNELTASGVSTRLATLTTSACTVATVDGSE